MKRLGWIASGGLGLAVALEISGCSLTPIAAKLMSPEAQQAQSEESMYRALDALKRGDTGAARGLLDDAVALSGAGVAGEAEIARWLIAHGRAEEAARRLQDVIKDKDNAWDPLPWGVLALAAETKSDTQTATTARKEGDQRALALLETAKATASSKTSVPVALVEKLIRVAQYHELGASGDPRKAIEILREGHRLAPDNVVIQNALGYMLAQYSQLPAERNEAVKLSLQAVQQTPDNSSFRGIVLDSYGWALLQRGNSADNDIAAARRVLRESADLTPTIPEIRYHLGRAYEANGRPELARVEYQRAIALRPDFGDAKKALDGLPPAPSPSPLPSSPPLPSPSPEPAKAVTVPPTPSPTPSPTAPEPPGKRPTP